MKPLSFSTDALRYPAAFTATKLDSARDRLDESLLPLSRADNQFKAYIPSYFPDARSKHSLAGPSASCGGLGSPRLATAAASPHCKPQHAMPSLAMPATSAAESSRLTAANLSRREEGGQTSPSHRLTTPAIANLLDFDNTDATSRPLSVASSHFTKRIQGFKPTRAQCLMVFNELDEARRDAWAGGVSLPSVSSLFRPSSPPSPHMLSSLSLLSSFGLLRQAPG